ncbi:MAG: T9SS type A sorting domain-containing protein [Salibacteraceae bacterium]
MKKSTRNISFPAKAWLAGAACMCGTLLSTPLEAQTFQTYYGTEENDQCHDIAIAADSGYVMVGQTTNPGFDEDALVIKTDIDGNLQWDIHFGGTGDQIARSVKTLNTGEYIVFGETENGSRGGFDWFLSLVDPSGSIIWTHSYGYTYDEYAQQVYQTSDDGFLLVGSTESFTTSTPNGTISAAYVVKTDPLGQVQWARWIGGDASAGAGIDVGLAGIEASNGEFYITGRMSSYGNPAPVSDDVFLARINPTGGLVSLHTYGHPNLNNDEGADIMQGSNGNLFIGSTIRLNPTPDGKPAIIEVDLLGNLVASDAFTGNNDQTGTIHSIQFGNSTGSVMLGGRTTDYGNGNYEYFLVEADASKTTVLLNKSYGNTEEELFSHMEWTPNGNIVHAGHSKSYPNPRHDWEVYLVKTDEQGDQDDQCPTEDAFDKLFNFTMDTALVWSPGSGTDDTNQFTHHLPNDVLMAYDTICGFPAPPADTGMGYQLAYKSSLNFFPEDICSTPSGYAITGYINATSGDEEVFILNADPNGNTIWSRSYGKNYPGGAPGTDDHGRSNLPTTDNGFVVFGESQSSLGTNIDWFLMKVDPMGHPQWTQRYLGGANANEVARKVVPIANGYLLVGSSRSFTSGEGIYVMAVDFNGNTIWSSVISPRTSSNIDVANDAVQDANGDIYITGRNNSYGAGKEDIFIAKYSSGGILQWLKTYGYSKAEAGLSIEMVNGELVVGAVSRPSGTDRDPTILITNLSGVVQHQKSFPGVPDLADRGVSVVPVDGGTNLLFSGWNTSFGGGDRDAFLYKTDINLSSYSWAYVYDLSHTDIVRSMIVDPGSQEPHILCASQTPSSGVKYDVLVHSPDANGLMKGSCEVPVSPGFYSWAMSVYTHTLGDAPGGNNLQDSLSPDTLLLSEDTLCGISPRLATTGARDTDESEELLQDAAVFPNPFNRQLTFTWQQSQEELVRLQIVNLQGQVLWNKEQQFGAGEHTLPIGLEELPEGIYLYSITLDGITHRGKVMKTN